MTTFLRRIHHKYHKLGKKKGKKRVWRKPKGRDNKMREKRRGYGATVSIGYRGKSSERQEIIVVRNVNELKDVSKGQEVVLGNVGRKKKIEMVKMAHEKGITVRNVKVKKFLESLKSKEEKK